MVITYLEFIATYENNDMVRRKRIIKRWINYIKIINSCSSGTITILTQKHVWLYLCCLGSTARTYKDCTYQTWRKITRQTKELKHVGHDCHHETVTFCKLQAFASALFGGSSSSGHLSGHTGNNLPQHCGTLRRNSDGRKKAPLANTGRVVTFAEVHCGHSDGETRRSSLWFTEHTRYVWFFCPCGPTNQPNRFLFSGLF